MISQRARYAFKAMVALARVQNGKGLQIKELAVQEQLPKKFLEQILLALKSAGYISSRRGPDGGYQLLKPADLIYIGPMLRAIDGPIAPLPCLSRTAYQRCDDCKTEAKCEVRLAFSKAYGDYLTALEGTSLAQVMHQADAILPPNS
jgi:Rrf2 family protein